MWEVKVGDEEDALAPEDDFMTVICNRLAVLLQ